MNRLISGQIAVDALGDEWSEWSECTADDCKRGEERVVGVPLVLVHAFAPKTRAAAANVPVVQCVDVRRHSRICARHVIPLEPLLQLSYELASLRQNVPIKKDLRSGDPLSAIPVDIGVS